MDRVDVTFVNGEARFTLHFPIALTELSVNNLRKLFKLMLTDYRPDVNSEAIRKTREALNAYAGWYEDLWGAASDEYRRDYANPKFGYGRERKAAEANNKKLLARVKTAKTKYERAQKLLTYFEEMYSMNFM